MKYRCHHFQRGGPLGTLILSHHRHIDNTVLRDDIHAGAQRKGYLYPPFSGIVGKQAVRHLLHELFCKDPLELLRKQPRGGRAHHHTIAFLVFLEIGNDSARVPLKVHGIRRDFLPDLSQCPQQTRDQLVFKFLGNRVYIFIMIIKRRFENIGVPGNMQVMAKNVSPGTAEEILEKAENVPNVLNITFDRYDETC